MPFDGTPSQIRPLDTALARMELLQEIAAKTNGYQGSFHSCLWSEVRKNHALRAAGLKQFDDGEGEGPTDDVAGWFGLRDLYVFGGNDIGSKRAAIERRIAVLRAEAPLLEDAPCPR